MEKKKSTIYIVNQSGKRKDVRQIYQAPQRTEVTQKKLTLLN